MSSWTSSIACHAAEVLPQDRTLPDIEVNLGIDRTDFVLNLGSVRIAPPNLVSASGTFGRNIWAFAEAVGNTEHSTGPLVARKVFQS